MSNQALRVILWPQGIDVTATGAIGIGAAVVVMIIVIFTIYIPKASPTYVF
jgi:hypothetical protein